jgi:hypothetical protein
MKVAKSQTQLRLRNHHPKNFLRRERAVHQSEMLRHRNRLGLAADVAESNHPQKKEAMMRRRLRIHQMRKRVMTDSGRIAVTSARRQAVSFVVTDAHKLLTWPA